MVSVIDSGERAGPNLLRHDPILLRATAYCEQVIPSHRGLSLKLTLTIRLGFDAAGADIASGLHKDEGARATTRMR
jgi:hypothetical protein